MALPSEIWQAIAVHFSTQELARGLTATCKRLRDLNLDAICITSTKRECFRCTCVRYTHPGRFTLTGSHLTIMCMLRTLHRGGCNSAWHMLELLL